VNPFLSLLLSVSSGVSDSELNAMKFLCRDKVGKRKLESVKSAMDLFSILLEKQEIAPDKLQFLRELLEPLHRDDLLSRVQQFEEEGELGAPGDQPDEHEKRRDVTCENVGRDWKKLLRRLGLSEAKLDRIEEAHRFDLYEKSVQGLREWQKWKGKEAKVDDLVKALRDCRLNLVADLVEE
ncbi:FADD protein, partial [Serilophus lunatus]|nr:FADD protein [Serilophus lunatus]